MMKEKKLKKAAERQKLKRQPLRKPAANLKNQEKENEKIHASSFRVRKLFTALRSDLFHATKVLRSTQPTTRSGEKSNNTNTCKKVGGKNKKSGGDRSSTNSSKSSESSVGGGRGHFLASNYFPPYNNDNNSNKGNNNNNNVETQDNKYNGSTKSQPIFHTWYLF